MIDVIAQLFTVTFWILAGAIWTVIYYLGNFVLAIIAFLAWPTTVALSESRASSLATGFRLNPDPADAKERQKQEYYKAAEKSQKRPTDERVQVICVRCRWQSSTVPMRATERTKSLHRFANFLGPFYFLQKLVLTLVTYW